MHPTGKTIHWIETKWFNLYNGLEVLYLRAKFGGRSHYAPAVGAKMVFAICCLSQKPARCDAFEGIIIRRGIVALFIGRFGFCFHIHFRRDCLFSCTRECPFPSPVEATIFQKNDVNVFAHHVNPTMEFGERCKLPQWGLGQSPSRNWIRCILALKSDIWWQQV